MLTRVIFHANFEVENQEQNRLFHRQRLPNSQVVKCVEVYFAISETCCDYHPQEMPVECNVSENLCSEMEIGEASAANAV